METQLLKSTKTLYSTFKTYTVLGDLKSRSCDCCVTNEEIILLLSKSLNELTDDDIGHFSRSAITTFGDIEDFKHFLPRILELMQNSNSNILEDFITYEKLNYSEWGTWNEDEINAIDNYFLALWEDVITDQNATFHQIGCAFNIVSKYSGLKKAIILWENVHSLQSTLFIAELLINGLQYYIDKEHVNDLTNWFYTNKVLLKIEKEFFNSKDSKITNTLSIAYSIIENKYI